MRERYEPQEMVKEEIHYECGHVLEREIIKGTLGFLVGLKAPCPSCPNSEKQLVKKEVAM